MEFKINYYLIHISYRSKVNVKVTVLKRDSVIFSRSSTSSIDLSSFTSSLSLPRLQQVFHIFTIT